MRHVLKPFDMADIAALNKGLDAKVSPPFDTTIYDQNIGPSNCKFYVRFHYNLMPSLLVDNGYHLIFVNCLFSNISIKPSENTEFVNCRFVNCYFDIADDLEDIFFGTNILKLCRLKGLSGRCVFADNSKVKLHDCDYDLQLENKFYNVSYTKFAERLKHNGFLVAPESWRENRSVKVNILTSTSPSAATDSLMNKLYNLHQSIENKFYLRHGTSMDKYNRTKEDNGTELILGLEMEIESFERPLTLLELHRANQYFKDNYIITEGDGSLKEGAGIEIKTVKGNVQYHKDRLKALFENLSGDKIVASARCGVHIHTSKKSWSNKGAYRLHAFVNSLSPTACRLLFNRLPSRRYCKRETGSMPDCDISNYVSYDRYVMVNFSSYGTIELRAFKGVKTYKDILIYLDVIKSLYDYCNHTSLVLKENEYFSYVLNNKHLYNNLSRKLERKRICV